MTWESRGCSRANVPELCCFKLFCLPCVDFSFMSVKSFPSLSRSLLTQCDCFSDGTWPSALVEFHLEFCGFCKFISYI